MRINAYLHYDGTCAEAFRFYETALGGRIESMMTYGDSPMAEQMPPETKDLVMHAALIVGEGVLMGSDAPPHMRAPQQGFSVAISTDSIEEAERVFAALSDGGTVGMPMQKMFWTERFGMVKDRFGTPWLVNGPMLA